ncbi:uncharacterized protein LOC111004753 [Momordica charantia]|uniref:Uncharacterized protein LOC111004753 n=1 Tax=Momordica charantia TaxID=3673 RepID=A0A6J1BRI9_MOMCH|nr:uncharacterized protein LOC111004753 [Momordica charantia]
MSNIPQEIDDYIKESIYHSLGLPVSKHTLELKLVASEAAQQHLRVQCLSLQSKLNHQILAAQSSKAEAKLSAQALKKAIEKNGDLSEENSALTLQCKKLKAFANKLKMAVDRANEETARVRELEQEMNELTDDLYFFQNQYQTRKFHSSSMEEDLVDSVLAAFIGETEAPAAEFLLHNAGYSSCRRLLYLSNSLSPATQKALSLAAKIKELEKNKEELQLLLRTAQEEVKFLNEQIDYLMEDQTSTSHEEGSQRRCGGKPPASSDYASVKLHGGEQSDSDD